MGAAAFTDLKRLPLKQALDGDQIVTVVLLSPHRLRVKMKAFKFFNVKKGKKTS